MRSVLRTPCAGGLAPSQRGRAWSRAPRQKTPGSIAVFAAGSSSHEASGRSSSPSRGASAAKAVASSGRSAVDAPTSSSSSSPEIVGPKSGNGAGAAAASSPSGPLLKAVRSSRPAPPNRPDAKDVVAVVLAGGASKNPLAATTAPAALSMGNMTLVDIPVNNCFRSGINLMFVLTQFNSHELNAHVARAYPPALFGGPAQQGFVDVLACHQTAENTEWAKGSADAVRRHLRQIMDPVSGSEPPTHVLITSGTTVTTLRYSDLIEAHKRSGADVTLATQSVPAEGAGRRGLLAVAPAEDGGSRAAGGNSGSDGRVMAFAEKPEGAALDAFAGASPWTSGKDVFEASMGVYVFRADALRALLAPRRVGGNTVATTIASVDGYDDDDFDDVHFGEHVVPHALSAGFDVRAHHHGGFWADVLSLRDYVDVSLALASPSPPVALHGGGNAFVAPPAPPRGVAPPSRIGKASSLTRTLVGEGCVLRGCELVDCCVGNNSHVGSGSKLEKVVFVGSDFVGDPALARKRALSRERAASGEGASSSSSSSSPDSSSRPASSKSKVPFAVPGVGENCVLKNVVLDRNASVGDGCVLVNENGIDSAEFDPELGFLVADGLIVIPRGSIVPPGTNF